MVGPHLRIPQSAVAEDLSAASHSLGINQDGGDTPDEVFPERLVLKNSIGFGGTNESLLFANVAAE